MATLTPHEIETLSSKAQAAKAAAYCESPTSLLATTKSASKVRGLNSNHQTYSYTRTIHMREL